MRPFHVIIHWCDCLNSGFLEKVQVGGLDYGARRLGPEHLTRPLTASFDDALDQLSALTRMFTEPDGSFVWVGQKDSESWQLDGQLHDGATGLMNVELKGTVDTESFAQLIRCLGTPVKDLVFQLVREGVFVDIAQFEQMIR